MECSHYRPHLRGAPLSVYEFAVALSRESGLFFASNTTTCEATGYGRDTVIQAKKTLVAAGWFQPQGGNRDEAKRGGRFRPDRFRVVEHSEWAERHPGQCPIPVSEKARVGESPRRDNSDAGKANVSASGKSDNPASGKPRRNNRDTTYEIDGTGETGRSSKPPLPGNPWESLGLNGGTGNSDFDGYWERLYAVQHDFMSMAEIIAGAVGGTEFDGGTVPLWFLHAADARCPEWRAERRRQDERGVWIA